MDSLFSKHDLAKQKLMDGGEKLFAAFGYEGTSVRMIGKHMKINPAMIDYYFGSKENLYNEIFNLRLKVLNEGMMKIETMEGGAIEKVDLFFATYRKSVERNKNFHKLFLREMYQVNHQNPTKKFIISSMLHHFELLKSIVEDGIKSKNFSAIDPGLFSLNFLMMAPMLATDNHFIDILTSCEKKILNTNNLPDNLQDFFQTILLNVEQPAY